MKIIYLSIAVLLFCITGCKKAEDKNDDTPIDTTLIEHDTVATEVIDTVSYDTTGVDVNGTTVTATTKVSDDGSSSDVKLPNKMSTSTTTIEKDPSKGKYPLAETKWRLIELNGKTVDSVTRRAYFINFDSKSGTFRAFVGCNKIAGNYFMKSANKIGFTNVITTRRACENDQDERTFFNNLQKVDNYMVEDKILHLHIGKKAVAKFEAIR